MINSERLWYVYGIVRTIKLILKEISLVDTFHLSV